MRTLTPSQMEVSNIPRLYAETLRVWELYDCSGIERSRGDHEMHAMWCRWRQRCGKPTVTTLAVRQTSLDESWTPFVRRWNTETSFANLVQTREERRRRYGLAETREKVCELA